MNKSYRNIRLHTPNKQMINLTKTKTFPKKNQFVKVSTTKERFFVKIDKIEKGRVYGTIANNLVIHKHKQGEKVQFPINKIISIHKK